MKRLAVIGLLVLAGCGGGPRVTETRTVTPFERIEVSDNLDVQVVPGPGDEIRVRAGEDVLDRIRTESSGGVLRLDVERGIVIGPDPLDDARVEVPASGIRAVTIQGNADVTMSGIDADALDLRVDGAGDIEAAGLADRLTATVDGAGSAELGQLDVRIARVTVDGAGDADLNVSESLDVVVDGAGDVSYSGDPNVQSDISGAGDLTHVGR